MATVSQNITFDSTTAVGFRAWTKAISDALQTCGLVLASDTGQINFTTVSAPTSYNQIMGYQIFKLSDSLQATKPIYIKIEYGTEGGNAASPIVPSIWTTVGSATDGAGTIISPITVARYQHCTNQLSSTVGVPCLFAGDGTYIFFMLGTTLSQGTNSTYTPFAFFMLDRTRSADSTANSDGYWVIRSSYNSNAATSYWFPAASQGNSTVWREDFVLFDRYQYNARTGYSVFYAPGDVWGSGSDGTDFTCYPLLMQSSKQTFTNALLVGFNADLTNLVPITTTVLGGSHVYMPIKFTPSGLGSHAMLVRYE